MTPEQAFALVQASSCSLGCAQVGQCDLPRRLARGEHVPWHAGRGGVLTCRAREATTYSAAVTEGEDNNHHVVAWTADMPVPVRRSKNRGDTPAIVMVTAPWPEPQVRARPATDDEMPSAALKRRARAVEADWTVEAFYARGWTPGQARKTDGASEAAPVPVLAESVILRGVRGSDRFGCGWLRRAGSSWTADGVLVGVGEARGIVPAAELDQLIAS